MQINRKTLLFAGAVFVLSSHSAAFLFADTTGVSAPAGIAQTAGIVPSKIDPLSFLQVQASQVQGAVSVLRAGSQEPQPVTNGAVLNPGDTLETFDGSCRLTIEGRGSIDIERNTVLKITEAMKDLRKKSDATRLNLETGRVKVEISKLPRGSSFEVYTPTAVATVRGTTFYLSNGSFQGVVGSLIYVDESTKGVLFKNLISNQSVLVKAFSLSSALSDGVIHEPKKLSEEEQKKFVENWENGTGGSSQQFGLETLPLVPANPGPGLLDIPLPDLNDIPTDDAKQEKVSEQDNAEANGFGDETSTDTATDDDPVIDEEEETDTDPVITEADRDMILGEVSRIVSDQEFDQVDATAAQTADSQTGKVFSDIHGNRVRVDQYIFQSSPSSVSFLSLTSRSGEYQNGITAVFFMTQFNRPLTEADGLLRDLPWNDYMNVVTNEELTGPNVPFQFEQFIVHEHYNNLSDAPSLYPLLNVLFLTEPVSPSTDTLALGAISFGEVYTAPFVVTSDQGTFWAQGVAADFTSIFMGSGQELISLTNIASQPSELIFDGQFFGGSVVGREGSQTAGFASSPSVGNLDTAAGIDLLRNAAIHPAFFEDVYSANDQSRLLYGIFVPIDDAGQVIDAPGFRIRGVRDLLYPNTLVNGGNYNLETIFVYGDIVDGSFQESIRVDAIITPEIFSGYGVKNPDGTRNNATVFPSTLELDPQEV